MEDVSFSHGDVVIGSWVANEEDLSKIHLFESVQFGRRDEALKFIKLFGHNKNIKIRKMYGFYHIYKYISQLKCKVSRLCLWRSCVDNIDIDLRLLKTVKTIKIKTTDHMCISQKLLDLAYDWFHMGYRVIMPMQYNITPTKFSDDISDQLIIGILTDISLCNKNARKVFCAGSISRIRECLLHFESLVDLEIRFTSDKNNDVFLEHQHITNLKKLSIVVSTHLRDEVLQSLAALVENNKGLKMFSYVSKNTNAQHKFTSDTFRNHPRLKHIHYSGVCGLDDLLTEAKQIDDEFRRRYIKVAAAD